MDAARVLLLLSFLRDRRRDPKGTKRQDKDSKQSEYCIHSLPPFVFSAKIIYAMLAD